MRGIAKKASRMEEEYKRFKKNDKSVSDDQMDMLRNYVKLMKKYKVIE